MTSDNALDSLKLRIKELDAEIERVESNLENMKSERKDIKRRIFQIINSQHISTHITSSVKSLNERKFK